MSKCAVIMPIYRWPLTPSEAFFVQKTIEVLGDHDLYWVGPKRIEAMSPTSIAGCTVGFRSFSDYYFRSSKRYNQLMMSRRFYTAFKDYPYILIVQTDVLVLRDELEEWCTRGYSYIGAPWFEGYSKPDPSHTLIGVGNGGFSLRRVPDFIHILSKVRYTPHRNWLKKGSTLTKWLRFMKHQVVFAYTIWPLIPRINEDSFWGMIAPTLNRTFTVPTPEVALKFAFEVAPEKMYELAGGVLPFGCHAWEFYNKRFWMEQLGEDYFGSHIQHAEDVSVV